MTFCLFFPRNNKEAIVAKERKKESKREGRKAKEKNRNSLRGAFRSALSITQLLIEKDLNGEKKREKNKVSDTPFSLPVFHVTGSPCLQISRPYRRF